MLGCFAVWWVERETEGEIVGGGGGRKGLKAIAKWISFTWKAFIPFLGPVEKYPEIFFSVLPLKRLSTRKWRFPTPETQVFKNGP